MSQSGSPRGVATRTGVLLALTAGTSLIASGLRAQDAATAPVEAVRDTAPPPVDVTGFVDVYYQYNFNKVDPALRSFDVQHNAFSLSLADVALSKAVTTDSRVGFRAELAFGKTADLIAAYEPEADGKEIGEAHPAGVRGACSPGSKLQLDAGKFLSPLGAEVVRRQDNWNYSRSVLFGYAIPFYHLGVRATLPVNDKVSLAGYLVNGWNNATRSDGEQDRRCGRDGEAERRSSPGSPTTWAAGRSRAADTRHIFDTTLTLTPRPRSSASWPTSTTARREHVSWWGVAAYAKVQVRPSWSLVGRYEYLDDTDGGFMTIGQKAQTLTVTSDHLVAAALRLRLEYRGDFTRRAVLHRRRGGQLKDSQHAVLVGLVCTFGGKI